MPFTGAAAKISCAATRNGIAPLPTGAKATSSSDGPKAAAITIDVGPMPNRPETRRAVNAASSEPAAPTEKTIPITPADRSSSRTKKTRMMANARLEKRFDVAVHPAWAEPFSRPLTQLLFAAELSAWGLQASRYVLAQVLLHAANATILFALFRGPLGSPAAAGAAILFSLGLGFYGETVWRAAALGTLLATTFVLGTGIVALRAQLESAQSVRRQNMAMRAQLETPVAARLEPPTPRRGGSGEKGRRART